MTFRAVALVAWMVTLASSAAAQIYYPDRLDWQRRAPHEAGMSAAALDEAVKFAIAAETEAPRDQALTQAQSFGAREPHSSIIGPMKVRAAVTKTFLTTVVGIAWQKGQIRDVNDRVRGYLPAGVDLFDDPHNQAITWDHLLRQTSDWRGTLWSKPDWADRPEGPQSEWANRRLSTPGTRYKYNDVRVNVLALATLHVLRRPLPEVLREELMDPIGASGTWRWHGYENSWIEIDGRKVQSVSGGGHWGGGMFIDAWDLARFGYLFLRNGRWQDRQLVSEKWIQMARAPGTVNREYGHANWYLNTDRKPLPAAPESSVTFRGAGSNIVYIDWENDLVVVVRWIRGGGALNEFIGKVLAAASQ